MATKISTGTPIKLRDSSVGIIDFLVSYSDTLATNCPKNYANGKIFSDNVNYISVDTELSSNFFGNHGYTKDQNFSKFYKKPSDFPTADLSAKLLSLSGDNIAHWNNFKTIVINSFIPLTNIRYCEFIDYSIDANNSLLSTKKAANIFLTNDSILSNYTNFKDLFLNNTNVNSQTIISSYTDFINKGDISSNLSVLDNNVGINKVITVESLNSLLSVCVAALNKIRTSLPCKFTNRQYILKYSIKDANTYFDTTETIINKYVEISAAEYTLPSNLSTSILKSYKLKPDFSFDIWYSYNLINKEVDDLSGNSSITFSRVDIPLNLVIGIKLKKVILNNVPVIALTNLNNTAPHVQGHGPGITNSTFGNFLSNNGINITDVNYSKMVGFIEYSKMANLEPTAENKCTIKNNSLAICSLVDKMGDTTRSSAFMTFVFLPYGDVYGKKFKDKWNFNDILNGVNTAIKNAQGSNINLFGGAYTEHYNANFVTSKSSINNLQLIPEVRGYLGLNYLCFIKTTDSTTLQDILCDIDKSIEY